MAEDKTDFETVFALTTGLVVAGGAVLYGIALNAGWMDSAPAAAAARPAHAARADVKRDKKRLEALKRRRARRLRPMGNPHMQPGRQDNAVQKGAPQEKTAPEKKADTPQNPPANPPINLRKAPAVKPGAAQPLPVAPKRVAPKPPAPKPPAATLKPPMPVAPKPPAPPPAAPKPAPAPKAPATP